MEKEEAKAFKNGMSVNKTCIPARTFFAPLSVTFLVGILISTCLSIAFTGCTDFENYVLTTGKESSPVNNHITTVIYSQIRDPNVREVSDFAIGEVPAIKIQDYPGTVALFKVVNESNGNLIRAEKITTSEDKAVYWPLPGLEPGSYVASLRGMGFFKPEFWTFTVGVGKENIIWGIEESSAPKEY
ncbi:MAG: hypothetical protein ACYSUK_03255 [Planctomycetota bacterium]|jgi:hypothetical protein